MKNLLCLYKTFMKKKKITSKSTLNKLSSDGLYTCYIVKFKILKTFCVVYGMAVILTEKVFL